MRSSGSRSLWLSLLIATAVGAGLLAQSSDPEQLYKQALVREAALRKELNAHRAGTSPDGLLTRLRTLVGSYRDIARLFPASPSSDNALWQGGSLAADAFGKFGEESDRSLGFQLLRGLTETFPRSELLAKVAARVKRLEAGPASPVPAASPAPPPQVATAAKAPPRVTRSLLKSIRREVLPDALRLTLELDREAVFYDERLEGPPRVFVDLYNTRAADNLQDITIPFTEDAVKQVRVGRQTDGRTRVVLDLAVPARHSIYALYNPYRVVIDVQRPAPAGTAATPSARVWPVASAVTPAAAADVRPVATEAPAPAAPPAPPSAPAANAGGGFSIARQLGLGISRIVIDPGHGGHDPGAKIRGLTEADLVLDVALRLEKLLKQADVDVVLTRRGNTYLSLEERTSMANAANADLFLSIHANANSTASVSGVETYFLNFAQNKEAEAVAARENAGSARSMHQLPDLVRAITLDNKVDESRDFARMVQASLYDGLRKVNRSVKNLGVKQAPFVVLIGATMPSVLSEIAFMTNRQDATLIKTEKYRQHIAEALQAGILRYQTSLEKSSAVAAQ